MHLTTIEKPLLIKIFILVLFPALFNSCDKEELAQEEQSLQHVSVLNDNSGWSSMAFDSEVFYPYGGFSGFDRIKLSKPFVHGGQPKAVAEYIKNSSTGSSSDIMAIVDGQVVRQPLSGSGDIIIDKEHLYRYLENDEAEFFVRRLNSPDYSSYNSFQWDADEIEREVRRLDYSVGNYISSGTPDFILLGDTLNAIQATYLNLRENETGPAQQRVVISRIELRNGTGYGREVDVLPFHPDLGENYYIDFRSKQMKGKILTVGFGSEQRNAYLCFGSFQEGFSFIKVAENVRGITNFFKGKDNFYCILKESGGSRSLAYKIDLNGIVTDLGFIESANDDAFTHYEGELVVSRLIDESPDNPQVIVEKVTAAGSELLGSSSLTKFAQIQVLMSDGDQLYGAAVNEISPLYQGGGRQFLGWEFLKYTP